MIDRYHEEAVAAETKIVHGCGFDSILADLGTKLHQSYAQEEFGEPCDYLSTDRVSVKTNSAIRNAPKNPWSELRS